MPRSCIGLLFGFDRAARTAWPIPRARPGSASGRAFSPTIGTIEELMTRLSRASPSHPGPLPHDARHNAVAPEPSRPRARPSSSSQRPRRRRHPRPSRARRHPHGLVPGRRRRRAAGRLGHRPLPRAPDVQVDRQDPDRRVLQDRRRGSAARTTPSPATTCTAYFQRIAKDRLQDGHGDGGRPHGQPPARPRRRC